MAIDETDYIHAWLCAEFPGGGRQVQPDIVLLGPGYLRLIEVKSWVGELQVTDLGWLARSSDGKRAEEDALGQASRNAKKLKAALGRRLEVSAPYIQEAVWLPRIERVDLIPEVRDQLLGSVDAGLRDPTEFLRARRDKWDPEPVRRVLHTLLAKDAPPGAGLEPRTAGQKGFPSSAKTPPLPRNKSRADGSVDDPSRSLPSPDDVRTAYQQLLDQLGPAATTTPLTADEALDLVKLSETPNAPLVLGLLSGGEDDYSFRDCLEQLSTLAGPAETVEKLVKALVTAIASGLDCGLEYAGRWSEDDVMRFRERSQIETVRGEALNRLPRAWGAKAMKLDLDDLTLDPEDATLANALQRMVHRDEFLASAVQIAELERRLTDDSLPKVRRDRAATEIERARQGRKSLAVGLPASHPLRTLDTLALRDLQDDLLDVEAALAGAGFTPKQIASSLTPQNLQALRDVAAANQRGAELEELPALPSGPRVLAERAGDSGPMALSAAIGLRDVLTNEGGDTAWGEVRSTLTGMSAETRMRVASIIERQVALAVAAEVVTVAIKSPLAPEDLLRLHKVEDTAATAVLSAAVEHAKRDPQYGDVLEGRVVAQGPQSTTSETGPLPTEPPDPAAKHGLPSPPARMAVTVPDLVGTLWNEELTVRASSIGLTLTSLAVVDGAGRSGVIVGQNPEGGSTAREGDTLFATVASGMNRLPAVSWLPMDEATSLLVSAGFVVEAVVEPSPGAIGRVLATSVAEGSRQPVGARVVVTVGGDDPRRSVPPVLKMSLQAALATLTQAGFAVDVRGSRGVGPEIVVEQRPAPGVRTRIGSTVSVVVDAGDDSPGGPRSVGVSGPTGPSQPGLNSGNEPRAAKSGTGKGPAGDDAVGGHLVEVLETEDGLVEVADFDVVVDVDVVALADAAVLETDLEEDLKEELKEVEEATETDEEKAAAVAEEGKGFVISDVDEDDAPLQTVMVAGATADPVKDYLKQIGRVSLLNAEQEIELAKRIEAGLFAEEMLNEGKRLDKEMQRDLEWIALDGRRAKNHLLEANLRLVVSLAKRYTGRGMLFLDLIQEGNLGLMRAVEKYDHTKGYHFSTYATWWIRQGITRAMADQARTIRIPVHMVEVINKLARLEREMFHDLGREPTPEELARELEMTPEKVVEVQKYGRELISLDWLIELGYDFVDEQQAHWDDHSVSFTLLQGQLESVLDSLSDREAGVVRMRFGLTDGQPKTLDEIGKVYGVTRERIRRIEMDCMDRLRDPTLSRILRDYLD